MQHLPVHWTEGLFLTAQHFQASERHWTELLARSVRCDEAYYYGLREMRHSAEAIANLSFQVDACEARTRKGTLVSFGEGEEPDRIGLSDALADGLKQLDVALAGPLGSQAVTRVFLALPKLRLGMANAAPRGDGELCRFTEIAPLAIQDENTGGNDQEVAFRTLNVKLIAKPPRPASAGNATAPRFDDDDPDYELLPIAQVRRGGEAGPELDESYIPPLLACDAWPPLQRGILQTIYDRIGNRIERLSSQVIARQITLASQEPADLERLLLLMRLNEAYASLGILAFAKGVHPFVAYHRLAEIVGQLSIFDKVTRRPPAIPKYDHDDLGTIFRWMMRQIDLYLGLERPGSEPQFRPFIGRGLGMQVTLDPQWLGAGFKWYVGVKYEGVSAEECKKLLEPNFLFWKLGSLPQVDALFRQGKPGLILVPQEYPPRELPSAGWIYFEVTRTGDAWRDVEATQTLAMRYKDTLVSNRESLEGHRTLVINVPPRKVELQFGLWAVPTRA